MQLARRPFRDDMDKARMAALVALQAADHLHTVDLPYRLSSWAFDEPENVALWETAEEASGFRSHWCDRRRWARGEQWPGWLGSLKQCAHVTPALLEEAALLGKRDPLVEAATWAEIVTKFVVRRTEPGSGAWRSRTRASDRSVV